MRSRRFWERRSRDERGVALIIVALLMVVFLIIAALVIDVGRMRARGQSMQAAADLAALASADGLGKRDVSSACQAAVNYLKVNVTDLSSVSASGLCLTAGNDVTSTTCSGGALSQATPSTTVNGITISIHYPVPDSEITTAKVSGPRVQDGLPCERMRVIVTDTRKGFFSGIAGQQNLTATRSATVRVKPGDGQRAPALWLLDPHGCVSLAVSGNSQVTVGNSAVASGLITIDSDGTTCNSNQMTLSSIGTSTTVNAVGTSASDPGKISLHALPTFSPTCVAPACDPADVAGGRISPQPVGSGRQQSRTPVDWKYNCKSGYPLFHGITIGDCPNGTPAYLDNLRTRIGTSGLPSPTFQRWTTTGHSCNVSGTVTVSGNWWIDCPNGQGLSIGNGTTLTFTGGNLVFDGPLTMTGGTLNINTANPTSNLSATCLPPLVTIPCIDTSAATAAIVYVRTGAWNLTGGTINGLGITVVQQNGYLKMSANPPTWHAPTEGPFVGLSYWSELSSNKFQVAGGSGASLSGVFFAPEAVPFSLTGGGNWGQQNAQFIVFQLAVSGGGVMSITPNQDAVKIPDPVTTLIR
jgi:Flp pilus assembly protein TadG